MAERVDFMPVVVPTEVMEVTTQLIEQRLLELAELPVVMDKTERLAVELAVAATLVTAAMEIREELAAVELAELRPVLVELLVQGVTAVTAVTA